MRAVLSLVHHALERRDGLGLGLATQVDAGHADAGVDLVVVDR